MRNIYKAYTSKYSVLMVSNVAILLTTLAMSCTKEKIVVRDNLKILTAEILKPTSEFDISMVFGYEMQINTSISKQLKITNSALSDEQITISDIKVPKGFSLDFTKAILKPKESKILTVILKPTEAKVYQGNLEIVSDITDGKNVVGLYGKSVKYFAKIFIDGNLNFESVAVNKSKTKEITIYNDGKLDMVINDIKLPTKNFTANWSKGVIPPNGSSQVVQITFTPDKVGDFNGKLEVVSDKTEGNNILPITAKGI